jgi:hypothetical protein
VSVTPIGKGRRHEVTSTDIIATLLVAAIVVAGRAVFGPEPGTTTGTSAPHSGPPEGIPMARRTWSDLTPTQQTAVLILGSVQVSLAATAWADLARR